MSVKISMFSPQVMSVRKLIKVDTSPAAKPLRVKPASATICASRPACSLPARLGTRAATMAASSSAPR